MMSLFLLVLAYLMGSICSAVIVCKSCSLPDPRKNGSQNPGATNVLRLAGKKYASLVLVVDLLKGAIPVLIAKFFVTDPMLIGFVALAAVLGHMYPVFFGFKGGKGVATAIGALFGFQFLIGIMVGATWLLVAKFSRYSSLASIISLCLAPFYSLLVIGNIDVCPPMFFMALFILIKHKHNIGRLIDGVEPKIKLKGNVLEEVINDESVPLATAKKATPKKLTVKKVATTKTKTASKTVAKKSTATKKSVVKKPAKTKTVKKPTAKPKAVKKTTEKAKTVKKATGKVKAVKKPTVAKTKKPK